MTREHLSRSAPDVAELVRHGWASAGLVAPVDLRAFQDGNVGRDVDARPEGARVSVDAPSVGSTPLAIAHEMGLAYEERLDTTARSAGAHYTPSDVALGLAQVVIAGRTAVDPTEALTVWDPASGGGSLLLAAAEVLLDLGCEPARIVEDLLWGTDTDPGAVAVAEAALVLWATLHGAPGARPGSHLVVGDALLSDPPPVCAGPGADGEGTAPRSVWRGFAHVIANPPFQGQLTGGSVRSRVDRASLRTRWGGVVGAYTDTSTLFLVAATGALAPGGRLGMILPTSVLSARDARPARDHVDEHADLAGMWVATEPVFRAAVEVCAPVLVRRGLSGSADVAAGGPLDRGGCGPVQMWRRRTFDSLPPIERAGRGWSSVALAAHDVPNPDHRSVAPMGSVARAASGFRDEYYGLVGHVSDLPSDEAEPRASGSRPLITSGTIDPGRCLWGERPVRFAKQAFERPVVDGPGLRVAGRAGGPAARAASWADATLGPKVLVATQTRVGEAVVDEVGDWLPSTPTIMLRLLPGALGVPGTTEVDRLWALAAVVCSPLGTVAALAGSYGSARSNHAIKPTAASLLDLPLPVDAEAWEAGARGLRCRDQDGFVSAMADAYGLAAGPAREIADWWVSRAPW